MERKPDGGVVFRSVRAEEKEARRYDSHKQKAMEILFAKIQAEFEKEEKGRNRGLSMLGTGWNGINLTKLLFSGNTKPQRRRRTISRQSVASLQDGEELYEAVGDDPAYLEVIQPLHTVDVISLMNRVLILLSCLRLIWVNSSWRLCRPTDALWWRGNRLNCRIASDEL